MNTPDSLKFTNWSFHAVIAVICAAVLVVPAYSVAYAQQDQEQAAEAANEEAPPIPPEQLDSLVAPIALAAAPAQYRVTGVKTFLVGPNGVVYEKDMGADTLKLFESMDRYNPDNTWHPTTDDWPADAEYTE